MPQLENVKKVMEVGFDKRQKPSMLLSNLFKVKPLDGIKVEIQGRSVRNFYSVDVKLGTGGRYNSLDEYDKRDFVVPEYNDIANLSEEDVFKAQLGETEYEQTAKVINAINDGQEIFSDKQRRAEEKQASDALFYGKVALCGGNKIEYNKKATHSISVADKKWNTDNGDPIEVIKNAIALCLHDGNFSAAEWNLFLEESSLDAFLGNKNFKANSNWNEGIKRTDINMPVEATPGGMFHGRISVGSYLVNIWSYNEKYVVPKGYGFAHEGEEFGYIPSGCALLVPMNPNFKRYYGAINNVNAPTTPGIGGNKLQLVKQQQLPYAYDVLVDGSATTKYGVKSRPLLVPVDVDCFATIHNIV